MGHKSIQIKLPLLGFKDFYKPQSQNKGYKYLHMFKPTNGVHTQNENNNHDEQ